MGISLLRASAGSVSQEKENALCLSEFIVISYRGENKSVVTFFPRPSQCAVRHLRGKFHCPMHSTVWLIFSRTQRLKVNIGAGVLACFDLYFL